MTELAREQLVPVRNHRGLVGLDPAERGRRLETVRPRVEPGADVDVSEGAEMGSGAPSAMRASARFHALAAALILTSGLAMAASPLQLQPPEGWQGASRSGLTVYVPPGVPVGMVQFIVFPARPLTGAFDDAWSKARTELEQSLGLSSPTQTTPGRGRARGGEHATFAARYASAQGPRFVMFMGRGKQGALVTTALVSTDANAFDRHVRACTASFDTLDFGADVLHAEPAPAAAAPTPVAGQTPPTTAAAPAPGGLPRFDVPSGWARGDSNGSVVLSRTVYEQTLGGRGAPIQEFRLLVQPAVRLTDSPAASHRALWARLVGPLAQTASRPLPLRRRAASGAALYFDGDANAVERQRGRTITAMLYLVVDGDVAVPVVGLFKGYGEELRRELAVFLDSVRVPGGSGRRTPLYSLVELAGTWRASSAVMGQFVDSAGNYRGDASLATGETMTLGPDGQYESAFASVGGGNGIVRQHDRGRASVDDDALVYPSQGQPRRARIGGVGATADGRAGVLFLSITREDYPFLNATSGLPGAGDVYVSAH